MKNKQSYKLLFVIIALFVIAFVTPLSNAGIILTSSLFANTALIDYLLIVTTTSIVADLIHGYFIGTTLIYIGLISTISSALPKNIYLRTIISVIISQITLYFISMIITLTPNSATTNNYKYWIASFAVNTAISLIIAVVIRDKILYNKKVKV